MDPAQVLSDAFRAWHVGRAESARTMLNRYDTLRRGGGSQPRIDIAFSDARNGQAQSLGGDSFARLLRLGMGGAK